MNEMKERKAFFSSADMSVEVWDQAGGQNHPQMYCFVFISFCCKRIGMIDDVLSIKRNVRPVAS